MSKDTQEKWASIISKMELKDGDQNREEWLKEYERSHETGPSDLSHGLLREDLMPQAYKVFTHYKGGRYLVIGLGKHTETDEDMVCYYSLDHNTFWFRPLDEWLKPTGDGSIRFKPGLIDKTTREGDE